MGRVRRYPDLEPYLVNLRLQRGWDLERALATPKDESRSTAKSPVTSSLGTAPLSVLAGRGGVSPANALNRLRAGWDVDRALTQKPRRYKKRRLPRGTAAALVQLAVASGISRTLFYRRLDRGWDVERALSEPVDARFSRAKR